MFWMRMIEGNPTSQQIEELRAAHHVLEMPDSVACLAAITKILAVDLGFVRSLDKGVSTLGSGEDIPLWSYSAVEYLMGLDLSSFAILELGSGHSTIFFSRRARSVLSLESDADWAAVLKARNLPGVTIELGAAESFPARMSALGQSFDVISIDHSGNRYSCAAVAAGLLRPGGFIVVDNSEWYPNATELLRSRGLIQVDFHDFRALHHFRTVTSIFLHPEFRPKPIGDRLPMTPIGGKAGPNNSWDQRS